MLIILLSIFMIGAVSASSDTNNTADSKLTNNAQKHTNTKQINKKDNEVVKSGNRGLPDRGSNLKGSNEEITYEGNFTDLSTDIGAVEEGGTLNLAKNYKYTSGPTEGIKINKSITINGNGHTINGNSQSRIFTINNKINLTLKNLKLINGNVGDSDGGVIYSSNSNITITQSTFNNNYDSYGSGGAISSYNSTITITQSTFNNNKGEYGGVIGSYNSTITITNSTFNNNEGYLEGGVIYSSNGTITITQSTFNNNTATMGSGGAICSSNGTITITQSTFNNNYADVNFGGAIGSSNGNITITQSTFNNNTIMSYGGVIGSSNGTITITQSTFNNNYAYEGGVIYSSNGNITIKNSTFNNNTADSDGEGGGAIYVGAGSYIDVCNSNFTKNNKRSTAIFLSNGNNANIHNCIFMEDKVYCKSGNVDVSDCIFNPVKIIAPAVNTRYNEDKYLLITLTDNNDKVLTGVQITVDLNGAKTYTTNKNGQIKISTKGLVPKKYKATITYNGNEKYTKVSTTTTITVNKETTKLTAPDITTTYNINKNLIITLTDKQNKPLTGVQITVNLNSAKTYKTNKKGQITISTKGLVPKTYTAKIRFNGNENYTKSSTTAKIRIKEITQLTASDITTTYNINKYLIIILKDNQNNPVANAQITVNLNGAKTYKTNKKGQITISTKGLVPKTYTAKIRFNGNENYTKSSTTAKVTVKKATTKLTAPKVTTTYNINKNLVITLKDKQNKPLTNTQITVKLGNNTKTYTTNKKGQITIPTKKLNAKTYTTKITFKGNNNYLKSSISTKVIIKKATPKITAKSKKFKKDEEIKKYSITLNNNINQAMKTVTVALNVNGKNYKVKTNSKGVAIFPISNLNKKGEYTSTITYNGDKNYNQATKNVKLTIK